MNIICLLIFVKLVLGEQQISYHRDVGIPGAARIKKVEDAGLEAARIIGGSQSAEGAHPYFGGIVVSLSDGTISFCGSSLLTNTKVLTAGHCWWDGVYLARQFEVVLGSNRLFSGGVRRVAWRVDVHPLFFEFTKDHDLALANIERVEYNGLIQPIGLPVGTDYATELFIDRWAQVVGLGRTAASPSISSNQLLNHVTVQVMSNAECFNIYPANVITSTLCTRGTGGVGICGGDSGGPLSVIENGRYMLIGVASFFHNNGNGCNRGNPSGFVRVNAPHIIDWILDNIK